jgi:hypothetical protein
MKKKANYHVFSNFFSLLGSIQICDNVSFIDYDCCNIIDVNRIAVFFIEPYLRLLTQEQQDYIRWAFEYYMITQNAPFEDLRAEAQDLDFIHCDQAQEFLRLLGMCLYGDNYLDHVNLEEYEEEPDWDLGWRVFWPSPNWRNVGKGII